MARALLTGAGVAGGVYLGSVSILSIVMVLYSENTLLSRSHPN
jgi:hypothetical protein